MTDRLIASLRRRLREEGGFGLIELMVAMTVLNVGILAVFAGFSSAYTSLNRASTTSSGAAVAQSQVERFRAVRFSAICLSNTATDSTRTAGAPEGTAVATCTTTDPAFVTLRTGVTGPDNTLFRVDTYVVWACPVGTLSTSSPYSTTAPGCISESIQQAAATKRVRVTVRDNATISRVYATMESTFDSRTGL
jgi:Tfp pilus assembly protein PilV